MEEDYKESSPMNSPLTNRPKPMLCISEFDLPDLRDAKIGSTMNLTMEVRVTNLSIRRYDTGDNRNKIHADLEVMTIKKGGE